MIITKSTGYTKDLTDKAAHDEADGEDDYS